MEYASSTVAPPAQKSGKSKENKFRRLQENVKSSRTELSQFRERRKSLIEEIAGDSYADNGADHSVPYPLLASALDAHTMFLAARNPSVLVTTKHDHLRPDASLLELGLEHRLKQMKFAKTLRAVIGDALTGLGTIKIGMMDEQRSVVVDGERISVSAPSADAVDLDNWVHDTEATRMDRCAFKGDRYELTLQDLHDSDLYNKKAVAELAKARSELRKTNEGGDERISEMSRNRSYWDSVYQETVEVYDIYVPDEDMVYTLAMEIKRPLRKYRWEGPNGGMYRHLMFQELPMNAMPLPPLGLLKGLHQMVNLLQRKLSDQANRSKQIFGANTRNLDDARHIRDADDGEVIAITDPKNLAQMNIGGPDQGIFGFALHTRQMFNHFAGNLDGVMGLASQADTATQDQMLVQNASKRFEWLSDLTVEFTKEVVSDLGYWLLDDPLLELPVSREYAGPTAIGWQHTFVRDDIRGEFLDFNFNIAPYSMRNQSPSQILQGLMQLVNQIALPLAPQLQQQGVQIDVPGLMESAAKYMGLEDVLTEVFQFAGEPVQMEPEGDGNMPQNSSREYIRRNVPGASQRGQEEVLIAQAMGGQSQPAQAASLGRIPG